MSIYLLDILKFISKKLTEQIAEHSLVPCNGLANGADYIVEVQRLLETLEDTNSVFHKIPKEEAATIIVNSIFQKFPSIRYMSVADSSVFTNTINAGICNYFLEYELSQKTPVEDQPTTTPTDPVDTSAEGDKTETEESVNPNPDETKENDVTDPDTPIDTILPTEETAKPPVGEGGTESNA